MEEKIKIRPTLEKMEVGKTMTFPISSLPSVRTLTSTVGLYMGRRYKTKSNRENKTIEVTRTE